MASNLFRQTKHIFFILCLLGLLALVYDSYFTNVIVTDLNPVRHIVRLKDIILDDKAEFDYFDDVYLIDDSISANKSKGRNCSGNYNYSETLIETPGCVISRRNNFLHKSLLKKTTAQTICDLEKRIAKIDDENEILHLDLTDDDRLKNKENSQCTVMEIVRHSEKDYFEYGKEFNITGSLDISDKELVVTKCGEYINFDGHFPLKAQIQEKIKFWKESKNELPLNVIFISLDKTSRSEFDQMFVKTLPLLVELGFTDFQGHHSASQYTVENAMAFLAGMKACLPTSDECPLIWEVFDLNNYVTMYIEDGNQFFNLSGQDRFKKQPTDYYPNPLFDFVEPTRKKLQGIEHNLCMSSMNLQDFILDYTTRFLSKFMKTTTRAPFFTFTRLQDPIEGSTDSIYDFDESFEKFLLFLNSDSKEMKGLRESTLIIINTALGDKNVNSVNTGSNEFTEQTLPGLFIRLPDKMEEQFPNLNLTENLTINSKRLTSAFDIHQTLLHFLEIQGLKVLSENLNSTAELKFQPVLSDRSSLFLPVSDVRNCKNINVPPGNCACSDLDQ